MSAAFAKHTGRALTVVRHARTETRANAVAAYLAPLLGGFATGVGLGVLLWHLF